MTALPISYPVGVDVINALRDFPNLEKAISLNKDGRSELEIFRLLNNTHYAHITRLLEFVNRLLPSCGEISGKLLETKYPFQFEQILYELFLFNHLRMRLGNNVNPVRSSRTERIPDIEIGWQDKLIKIEIYTPNDFMGFQLLLENIRNLLKYLEIDRGFSLKISINPLHDFNNSSFYPYTIPKESEIYSWLNDFLSDVVLWLTSSSPNPLFLKQGPGNIITEIELIKLTNNEDERMIIITPSTRSTDTRLFFECGTACDTANSQWGKKILKKIRKGQCGQPAENIIRILVINFALADTGWPEFIAWPQFTQRFRETLFILSGSIKETSPYDIVTPAQLNFDCCFGMPVYINMSKSNIADPFIKQSGLNNLCKRIPAENQQELINELLEPGGL
ncbi:MAG: hypothetical protein M1438_14240 [Deltaproteobacteria bacterium]|nr:hypothetical protein [Deltaproteobacteria bacterium]